jgi:hypothetical protein
LDAFTKPTTGVIDMINKDKIYTTRDGREVRIYAIDGGVGKSMVHGATLDEAPGWFPRVWYPDGSHTENGDFDLIEVKPRYQRTLWMNMYLDYPDMRGHVSEAAADQAARDDRIACIKIDLDFEEGEGL